MHGIREPYKHGTRAALVGNPVYPKTGGREHHMAVKVLQYGIPRVLPHIKRAGSAFKNIFRGTPTVGGGVGRHSYEATRMAPLTRAEQIKSWFGTSPFGKYLAGSPEGRLVSGAPGKIGWAGKKLWGGAKGLASSPLTVGAGAWYGVPWAGKKLFGGDDEADAVTGVMKPGGYPEGTGKGKGTGTDTTINAAAFAKAQREERLNKYLQMMGYDQSKKTAIADALIDASKIVSDRGTLDRKNITGELINPAIQAFSKRLDKPQQIREAVGLMAAKAEIEKDLNKEKDALANQLTKSRIAVQEATLDQDNLGGDVKAHFLKQGKLPKGDDLATYARMRGIEVAGVPSTTEAEKWMKSNKKDEVDYLKQLKVGPGVYVVSDRILVIDENNNIQSVL